ncbi:MAG: hypothetical protein ACFB10_22860 [Salibacteraceae bacterium]
MWKDWSYKKRNRFLLGAAIGGLLLIWFLALSNTFGLMRQCWDMEERLEIAASLSGGLQDLQMRQERLMAITGEAGAAELDLHQELLERVSSYCVNNRLVLEEFPKPVISQSNDFQVETTIFTVEGRFIPLLRLVHDLEQEWGLGKISGVEFASRKNNRANRKELTVSISFQQVKRIKSKNT